MNRLNLLDFDRTLFRTKEFLADTAAVLEKAYGIDADKIFKIESVVDLQPSVFDLFEAVNQLNPNLRRDDIEQTLRSNISKNGYYYEDAERFVDFLKQSEDETIAIITVGNDGYQQFKRSFISSLKDVPMYPLLTQKGDFLSRELRQHDDIIEFASMGKHFDNIRLIDDRGKTFNEQMPQLSRLELIRLKRPGSNHEKEDNQLPVREVKSLLELIDD